MDNTTGLQPTKTVAVADDPRLSSGTKEFLKALNTPQPPELEKMSPVDARAILVGAQASVEIDYSGIEESEKMITAGGFELKLNLARPKGVTEKLPVFIFIHGGGWVLGDYPTHKRMVHDLVVGTGYAAVFVNYTPSPDEKYPRQIKEIYAACQWVAENGDEINVDGKNMAIVGNSVGGNMSAVTCLIAKEKGGPEFKLQILMWPVTNVNFETESYKEFGADRFLTEPLMKWMFDLYTTDEGARKSIYISPLQATTEQLTGLPPALVVTGESDILRDEGEAYGRKLDAAGVAVTQVRYQGMIHDFGLLNGLAHLPQVKTLFNQASAELKKYLG